MSTPTDAAAEPGCAHAERWSTSRLNVSTPTGATQVESIARCIHHRSRTRHFSFAATFGARIPRWQVVDVGLVAQQRRATSTGCRGDLGDDDYRLASTGPGEVLRERIALLAPIRVAGDAEVDVVDAGGARAPSGVFENPRRRDSGSSRTSITRSTSAQSIAITRRERGLRSRS